MSVLSELKNDVIEKIKKERLDVVYLSEIRTNMTSVHKVKIDSKEYILKFVLIHEPNQFDQTQNDYNMQRYQIMLSCGKTRVFPSIIDSFTLTIKTNIFGVIIEQLIEYTFFEGANIIFNNCGYDPVKTTVVFMQKLIDMYLIAKNENIIAHRDLVFENIMFDINLKLYFVDSGSAKSSSIETTEFNQTAPTRLFYAAPEYRVDHPSDTAELKEIYTIGLISMSFLEVAMNSTTKIHPQCGIIQWIHRNHYTAYVRFDTQFDMRFKNIFENHLLIDYFEGKQNNLLYRLLTSMALQSVSLRIREYRIVKGILDKIEKELEL